MLKWSTQIDCSKFLTSQSDVVTYDVIKANKTIIRPVSE